MARPPLVPRLIDATWAGCAPGAHAATKQGRRYRAVCAPHARVTDNLALWPARTGPECATGRT